MMDFAAAMGAMGQQPQQPGFGLGQPLVGASGQMAPPGGAQAQPGMMQQLQTAMQDPQMMQRLMLMQQMMQQQQQQQPGAPMPAGMPGMMGGGQQMGPTQASQGYLAMGGGLGARNR